MNGLLFQLAAAGGIVGAAPHIAGGGTPIGDIIGAALTGAEKLFVFIGFQLSPPVFRFPSCASGVHW